MAGIPKAAAGAFVAGWSNWIGQHQQCVVITIRRNADYLQEVAGCFAFGP